MASSSGVAHLGSVTTIALPASPSATRLRVLLVEDDPLVREVLAAALVGAGYDVHAEADGARVERAVAPFLPDIALLDLHLGDGATGINDAGWLPSVKGFLVCF